MVDGRGRSGGHDRTTRQPDDDDDDNDDKHSIKRAMTAPNDSPKEN